MNAELIKALKDAEMYMIYIAPNCYASCEAIKAIRAAADALEAAEKRIAQLEEDLKTREAEREVMQDTIKICEEAADRYKAQLPKEGEWIDEQRGRWIYAKCNLCGKVQDVRSNYCPNCGARMDECADGERRKDEQQT